MPRSISPHCPPNKVRDVVRQLAHAADSTAVTEPLDLIPGKPELRPADVLTTAALPGSKAALDIGISSPDSAGAGDDCCDAMSRRKLKYYGKHFGALGAQGIVYKPMMFSAYGRVHPEAASLLLTMARGAARRHGLGSHKQILRRARARIGTEIWKRATAMVRACQPAPTDAEVALIFGEEPYTEEPTTEQSRQDSDSTALAGAADRGMLSGNGAAMWA